MSEQQPITPPPAEGEMTDEELLRAYGKARRDYCYDGPSDDWPKRAERAATIAGLRAVEAAVIARRPAPAPQVEGEVAELVRDLNREVEAFVAGESSLRWLRGSDLVRIAKLLQSLASPAALVIPSSPELLEQLKSLPPGRVELHAEAADVAQALEPVPVSERLPGPGDCDAEGRCWLLTVEDEYPQWRLHSIEGAQPGGAMIWVPVDSDTGIMCDCFYTSHWLPAHALPLPSGEVEK